MDEMTIAVLIDISIKFERLQLDYIDRFPIPPHINISYEFYYGTPCVTWNLYKNINGKILPYIDVNGMVINNTLIIRCRTLWWDGKLWKIDLCNPLALDDENFKVMVKTAIDFADLPI